MLTDELEFSISQYVDGTLDADAARAVEEALANNVAARDAFNSFRRLNALLVDSSTLPELNWANVHAGINSTIDAADEADDESTRSRFRLTNYSRWIGSAIAVAAAVLVVLSVQLRQASKIATPAKLSGSINVAIGPGAAEGGAIAIGNGVGNPTVSVAIATPANDSAHTTLVAIGPSSEVASTNNYFADDFNGGQSGRVVIAGDVGVVPSTDAGAAPF